MDTKLVFGSPLDIDSPIVATSTSSTASDEPSAEQIAMIADMGFNTAQARKALRQTNGNVEQAIGWLFDNPGDMGEEPAATPAAAAVPSDASPPSSSSLSLSYGGKASLPAQYRLKAFISHKGPSVHSGHYVATIRQPQCGLPEASVLAEGAGLRVEGAEVGRAAEDEWVLFNDEKVARAPERGGEEMRGLAYLYVYERV